jgi:hypothetical protein
VTVLHAEFRELHGRVELDEITGGASEIPAPVAGKAVIIDNHVVGVKFIFDLAAVRRVAIRDGVLVGREVVSLNEKSQSGKRN